MINTIEENQKMQDNSLIKKNVIEIMKFFLGKLIKISKQLILNK